MLSKHRCAAVITAAGASSRMGSLKALLDWDGKPLLQHQLDLLADWGEVIVVLGHEADRIREAVTWPSQATIVVNEAWSQGRSSSLARGVGAIASDPLAVLIVGVDQPLDGGVLDALLEVGGEAGAIARPVSVDRTGHPILFGADFLPELRQVEQEAQGLKSLAQRHAAAIREVPADDRVLLDLNDLAAYAAARQADFERTLARLAEFPIHSTRRSLPLFMENLRKHYQERPDLVFGSEDLFLAGFAMENNGNVWIHVAARHPAALQKELPGVWRRLEANLRSPRGYKAEAWLSSVTLEEAFVDLGFKLTRRLIRYRLHPPRTFAPQRQVRLYEDRDFDQLYALYQAETPPADQVTEAAYQEMLGNYDRTAVLELEGAIVGYTHSQKVDDLGLLQGLLVDSSVQGRGYGNALMQDAVTHLAESGVRAIELLVLSDAMPARRLYERLGFVTVGEQTWVDRPIPAVESAPAIPL